MRDVLLPVRPASTYRAGDDDDDDDEWVYEFIQSAAYITWQTEVNYCFNRMSQIVDDVDDDDQNDTCRKANQLALEIKDLLERMRQLMNDPRADITADVPQTVKDHIGSKKSRLSGEIDTAKHILRLAGKDRLPAEPSAEVP